MQPLRLYGRLDSTRIELLGQLDSTRIEKLGEFDNSRFMLFGLHDAPTFLVTDEPYPEYIQTDEDETLTQT